MGTLHLVVNVRSSHLEAMPGDWLPARLVFYFLTLAPHDYVIYCQARGLSGHTSPHGECVCFVLEDSVPLEAKEEYLLHSWSDSKWAHFVHCEEIFDSELELLTPLWQAILRSLWSAMVHGARRQVTLLSDRLCCSATVHTAR